VAEDQPLPTVAIDLLVAHPDRVRPWRLQRERYARVAHDVLDLSVAEQVSGDDLVVLDPDLDDRHLGTAVGVERDQMRERPGLDQFAN